MSLRFANVVGIFISVLFSLLLKFQGRQTLHAFLRLQADGDDLAYQMHDVLLVRGLAGGGRWQSLSLRVGGQG